MDSSAHDFLALLAYAYLRHGKAYRAVTALEGAQALRPSDGWISRTLAYALLLAQDYNGSLAQAERHARTHGSDEGLELMRSRALYALGRREEAARIIDQLGDLRGICGDRPS